MPEMKGRPIVGAVLGGLAALVIVLILQQGAVAPLTRFSVFVALGLGIGLGSLLLSGVYRVVTVYVVQSVAVALLALGLTGIPALGAHGGITGGCTASGASTYPDIATPATTSIANPFDVDPDGLVRWKGTSPGPFTDWDGVIAMDIAGFAVPIWTYSAANELLESEKSGIRDVAADLDELESYSGIRLSGVYHVWGEYDAEEGFCEFDAYVRIAPESLFAGPILVGLWSALALIVLIIIVYLIRLLRAGAGLASLFGGGATGAAAAASAPAASATPAAGGPKTTAKKPTPGKAAAKKPAAKKPAAKKPPARKPPTG